MTQQITVDDIYNHMQSYLYCRPVNRYLLEMSLATVVARKLARNISIEPVWLMIIGSPSSGKSLTLSPLDGIDDVVFMDDISECCLISGYRNEIEEATGGEQKSYSLAPELDGKTLLIKDLTRLLSKGKAAQAVMDQLRILYDGSYKGGYGNGTTQEINSTFNILGACTTEIDKLSTTSVSLGERFLYYRIPGMDRKEQRVFSKTARGGSLGYKGKAATLKALVHQFLRQDGWTVPECPPAIGDQLDELALLITSFRSSQKKDLSGRVIGPPDHEGPSRVVKQLLALCTGIASVRGKAEVGEHELIIARHIALSCIHEFRRHILSILWNASLKTEPHEQIVTYYNVMDGLRVNEKAARELLNQIYGIELADKIEKDEIAPLGVKAGYRASEEFKELVLLAGLEEAIGKSDSKIWVPLLEPVSTNPSK